MLDKVYWLRKSCTRDIVAIVSNNLLFTSLHIPDKPSISRVYDSILRVYDSISRVYDSISRVYDSILRVYDSILRVYDSILRVSEPQFAYLQPLLSQKLARVGYLIDALPIRQSC